MLIAERFISSLVQIHGKHPVSTDGGTWYPQACRFLNVDHHIHSSLEKSLIERTMQYIKDRTESFDDYFPCKLKNCKLKHVQNWLNLFAYQHNKIWFTLKLTEPIIIIINSNITMSRYWLVLVLAPSLLKGGADSDSLDKDTARFIEGN
jgi:hypothetical protein